MKRFSFKHLAMAGVAVAGFLGSNACAKTVKGTCLLVVDGKTYLNIKQSCNIDIDADGSFTIGVDQNPKLTYFAYLTTAGDGTAEGYWNGSSGATHAHSSLGGNFKQKGGCWVSANDKICAYR